MFVQFHNEVGPFTINKDEIVMAAPNLNLNENFSKTTFNSSFDYSELKTYLTLKNGMVIMIKEEYSYVDSLLRPEVKNEG